MSLDFYFSNQIEPLFDKLLENLNKDKNYSDPFYSPLILVPNINLKKWLQINIAKRNQISINIDFKYLEEGLTNILKRIKGFNDKKSGDYIFLGHKENHIYLQLLILSLILKETDETSPVYNFINSKNKNDMIKKAWQLSSKLTYYFREYEYHREEMIKLWMESNKLYTDNNLEEIQKIFYRNIFFKKDLMNKFKKVTNSDYTTLPHFSKNINCSKTFEDSIHIFSFSQISKYHYNLIFKLKTFFDIKFYQLNYLKEFSYENKNNWENIDNLKTGNEKILPNDDYDDLLKDLAYPSIEAMKIFHDLIKNNKSNDINSFWLFNQKKMVDKISLLNSLQNNILNKTIYQTSDTKLEQDDSIQIIACPGIYREVQTVYNSILNNLKINNELKLTDIAVLTPNMKKYKNIIKSVFSKIPDTDFKIKEYDYAKNHFLPYNLSDSTADIDSIFGNALISGLNLVEGSFNRNDIFDFLLNPCFLNSFNITRDEVTIWLDWIDKLNIYHNQDSSYNLESIFSWTHGLKRLRFGRIMEIKEFDGECKDFFGILPYSDINSSNEEKLNDFINIIEKLFDFLSSMKETRTGKEWIEKITFFIDTFLNIPDDLHEEKYIFYKLIENLNKLLLFDELFIDKIELGFIIEYIKSVLESIPSMIGKYLTDGITISALTPMRPIPFKIIYILGMNENEFPGFKDNSTLDLKNFKREIGDVLKPDANNYLFLETLLSTKEKLYITYISNDTQKDQILYPSSIINKLINYINNNLMLSDKAFEIITIPLREDSIKYFLKNNEKKQSDILNNYFYTERLLGFLYLKNYNNINNNIDYKLIENKYKITQELLKDNIGEIIHKQINKITLTDLYNFILNPVEAKIKKILDIYDEEDDDKILKVDEPFYSSFPFDYTIKKICMESFIQNKNEIDNLYNNFYKYNLFQGNTPEDIFADIDSINLKTCINNRINDEKIGLKNIIKGKNFVKIVIDDQYTSNDINKSVIVFPSLKFKSRNQDIELTGEIDNVFIDQNNFNLEIFVLTNSNTDNKYIIKPVLFYLMLLSNDEAKKTFKNLSLKIYILFKEKNIIYLLKKIEDNNTYDFLKKLIEDFLDSNNFDQLPFRIIYDKKIFPLAKVDRTAYKELLEEKLYEEIDNEYSGYKPMKIMEIIQANIPDDSYDKIKFRYKYFEQIDEIKSNNNDDEGQ